MPIEITMPALSPTMEKGKLAAWAVKEGSQVEAGDVLAEIETDKALLELEAAADGIVGKLLVENGTGDIPVNTVIAYLLGEGEDASVLENLPKQVEQVAQQPAPQAAPQVASQAAQQTTPQIAPQVATLVATQAVQDSPQTTPQAKPAAQVAPQAGPVAQVAPVMEAEFPPDTQMVELSVREALRDAMAEEMRADPNVFVIGEEVAEYQGAYKVTQGLLEEFGDRRVVDTPIVEQGFAGLGVGAAFAGLKPIVEFMTFNFAMQAIDQIVNSAAKVRYMSGGQIVCPIVFRGPNGAARRVAAQHSQDYSAWYAHVPGLKVLAPFSAADAKGLLKAAIRDPNPVLFLENELLYSDKGAVPVLDDFVLPIGRAQLLREGADATLVAHSRALSACLVAADRLAEAGIECDIINLRCLRPLDMQTIFASLHKTNRLVTVEEGWPICGIGAEIAAAVQAARFDDLDAPILRVTGSDVPLPYAANLELLALPDADKIIEAVNHVCYR